MKIHYLNAKGDELLIENIIHLQNLNDEIWEAVTKSNKVLTIITSRIEAVIDDDLMSPGVMTS